MAVQGTELPLWGMEIDVAAAAEEIRGIGREADGGISAADDFLGGIGLGAVAEQLKDLRLSALPACRPRFVTRKLSTRSTLHRQQSSVNQMLHASSVALAAIHVCAASHCRPGVWATICFWRQNKVRSCLGQSIHVARPLLGRLCPTQCP